MKPKPQLEWRQQAMDDLVAIVEYIAEDRDRKVLVQTERTETSMPSMFVLLGRISEGLGGLK
jgi:plasmid stabilization system protein ParE